MNDIHESIGKATQNLGGHLECEKCGHTEGIGNIGYNIKYGWPTCHGLTMTWITQKQIDDKEITP